MIKEFKILLRALFHPIEKSHIGNLVIFLSTNEENHFDRKVKKCYYCKGSGVRVVKRFFDMDRMARDTFYLTSDTTWEDNSVICPICKGTGILEEGWAISSCSGE